MQQESLNDKLEQPALNRKAKTKTKPKTKNIRHETNNDINDKHILNHS